MPLFTVYKVTNLIDGKIYIGKHKCSCSNCVYYGSGIHISKAIKKYGKKNFAKEILAICASEEEMNTLEEQIVTDQFIADPLTYNLSVGGKGGWDFVNRTGASQTEEVNLKRSDSCKEYWTDSERHRQSEALKRYNKEYGTERISEGLRKRYSDAEFLARFSETMRAVNQDEAKRKMAGEKLKLKWQDPEYLAKMKNRKPRGSKNAPKQN